MYPRGVPPPKLTGLFCIDDYNWARAAVFKGAPCIWPEIKHPVLYRDLARTSAEDVYWLYDYLDKVLTSMWIRISAISAITPFQPGSLYEHTVIMWLEETARRCETLLRDSDQWEIHRTEIDLIMRRRNPRRVQHKSMAQDNIDGNLEFHSSGWNRAKAKRGDSRKDFKKEKKYETPRVEAKPIDKREIFKAVKKIATPLIKAKPKDTRETFKVEKKIETPLIKAKPKDKREVFKAEKKIETPLIKAKPKDTRETFKVEKKIKAPPPIKAKPKDTREEFKVEKKIEAPKRIEAKPKDTRKEFKVEKKIKAPKRIEAKAKDTREEFKVEKKIETVLIKAKEKTSWTDDEGSDSDPTQYEDNLGSASEEEPLEREDYERSDDEPEYEDNLGSASEDEGHKSHMLLTEKGDDGSSGRTRSPSWSRTRSQSQSRSRSRSRGRSGRRNRSHSGSRSPYGSRSPGQNRTRSRTRSRHRILSGSRSPSPGPSQSRHHHRSPSSRRQSFSEAGSAGESDCRNPKFGAGRPRRSSSPSPESHSRSPRRSSSRDLDHRSASPPPAENKYKTSTASKFARKPPPFNPYNVLKICSGKHAPQEEIDGARKALLQLNHPDKLADATDEKIEEATARTAEINRAYDILGDPERRRIFDEEGITDQSLIDAEVKARRGKGNDKGRERERERDSRKDTKRR